MDGERFRQKIIAMTKNPMMTEFTAPRLIERLNEKDLIKVEKIMKKNNSLNIATFLRIFRSILNPSPEEDFYLTYGLFRIFQQMCLSTRKNEVSFSDISTMVSQKMPITNEQIKISEKLYPLTLQIPENLKKKIIAPQVIGKIMMERQHLQQRPYLSDKFIHINRRVGQSLFSVTNTMFFTMDYPSTEIKLLDSQFEIIKILKSELDVSKSDSIVVCLAWSESEQRLAALLGNSSISFWAKVDNYKYEVNIPLPMSMKTNPYIHIGFMQSSKKWYAFDNRPSISILSSYNFEPEHQISHFNMIKQKASQKIFIKQLKYRRLLCIAFEKNLFLVSLEKKEIRSHLRNFKTSINSINFSDSYQALFVSNFQNYFTSYELSEHEDLTQKGRFQGHKSVISLIGVLQNRPVVYSLDEQFLMKLWDIRDFQCYQTFSVLKNILFTQMLVLPEGICLVGSKNYCYRWQRYSIYTERQSVVLICQLEKNVLIVTTSEVRLFSHSNGVLLKVLKGIFESSIVQAYLVELRKMILLINDDGNIKAYSTLDFSLIHKFNMLPKPHYLFYERQTQLLTISCMGEIQIYELRQLTNLQLKRRIYNKRQMIRLCRASPSHDIVAVQFHWDSHLFLYSYERAKPLAFFVLQNLVNLIFHPDQNIIYLLCQDKILIMTYKRLPNNISFFVKATINLWSEKDLQKNHVSCALKKFSKIQSGDFLTFGNKIIVISNDALFHYQATVDPKLLKSEQLPKGGESYNPYRVNSENHLQAFDIRNPSIVNDDKVAFTIIEPRYIKHPGNRTFQNLFKINLFYCVTDQQNIIFYNLQSENVGVINFKQTLPTRWNLHNYSEEQFSELQFVYQFINQQKLYRSNTFTLTNPSIKSEQLITMVMLTPSKSTMLTSRSTSLREKKIVLQKERDDKQKQQNFQQIRKGDQLIKLKQINRTINERYIGESITFLNVNRNKLLLSKMQEPELPQIKAFQLKLKAAVNKDQKKSIVSKFSVPQQSSTQLHQITENQLTKSVMRTMNEIKLSQESPVKDNYKDRLKRLEVTLRETKFNHKKRSGSLPSLKSV